MPEHEFKVGDYLTERDPQTGKARTWGSGDDRPRLMWIIEILGLGAPWEYVCRVHRRNGTDVNEGRLTYRIDPAKWVAVDGAEVQFDMLEQALWVANERSGYPR